MINDINNLAAHAYQYRIRPSSMGGGGNSYASYRIPSKMASNENATYSLGNTPSSATDPVVFVAKSVQNSSNTVTVTIGTDGRPSGTWTYTGDFL